MLTALYSNELHSPKGVTDYFSTVLVSPALLRGTR